LVGCSKKWRERHERDVSEFGSVRKQCRNNKTPLFADLTLTPRVSSTFCGSFSTLPEAIEWLPNSELDSRYGSQSLGSPSGSRGRPSRAGRPTRVSSAKSHEENRTRGDQPMSTPKPAFTSMRASEATTGSYSHDHRQGVQVLAHKI
jgi:hypothetical protein